jgi:hypothetical protein
MLAGCVAQTPAPPTTAVAPVAFTPPPANWQWTDAPVGPTITLHTTDVTPTASSGTRTASLGLVCSNAVPTILVAWDAPVASAGTAALSYRFDGGPERDLAARSADPRSEIVSDPLVVSRFIDEAAASRQLVVRAGSNQATFATGDDSGNLTRFRTACPDGTN